MLLVVAAVAVSRAWGWLVPLVGAAVVGDRVMAGRTEFLVGSDGRVWFRQWLRRTRVPIEPGSLVTVIWDMAGPGDPNPGRFPLIVTISPSGSVASFRVAEELTGSDQHRLTVLISRACELRGATNAMPCYWGQNIHLSLEDHVFLQQGAAMHRSAASSRGTTLRASGDSSSNAMRGEPDPGGRR